MDRSPPDELIEDLRSAGRVSSLTFGDDIPLDDILEWEAADWIEAACALLEATKSAGGDNAAAAAKLLSGDYPVGVDDRRIRRFE